MQSRIGSLLVESGDPTRVLHVDTDNAFLERTATWFEREMDGVVVQTETSPTEAFDVVDSERIDCVLVGNQFADMDGLDLVARLRERAPDLPVFLCPDDGSEQLASAAISAGVADYFPKEQVTTGYEQLADSVTDAVARYRQVRKRDLVHEALETVSEGIALLDSDRRVAYVNRSCALLYGYDPSGILGERYERLVPAYEASRLKEMAWPKLEQTGAWRGRSWGLRADESTFPKSLSITTLDDRGYVCVVRDITEQVEQERTLERERNRVSALFDNMDEPTAYFEFQGEDPIVREINEAFEETFGLSQTDARGRSLDDLIVPPEHVAEGQRINERVRAGEIIDLEVDRLAADGVRTFQLLSVPLEPETSGEYGFTIYRTLDD